jgi:hypothetical protein
MQSKADLQEASAKLLAMFVGDMNEMELTIPFGN